MKGRLSPFLSVDRYKKTPAWIQALTLFENLMKSLLLTTAVVLALSACSEKTEPAAPAAGAPAAPAAVAPVFTKADVTRPASLPAELAAVTTCSFDRLNGNEHGLSNNIADKTKVSLNGWSADIKATVAPGPVFVELDGPVKLYAAAQRGLKRPDVAGAHNNPVLQDAGWEANIDMSAAVPGEYKVNILEVNGTAATTCNPNSILVIAG